MEHQFSTDFFYSADGTAISCRIIGNGPSLVVVPGTARSATDYDRLACLLAERFTVYVVNRRGRGQSGPQGSDYSIVKEREDITTILRETQAVRLFGHSYGGLICLEAALVNPLEKLALYEPAVSVEGTLSFEWLSAFEEALGHQDYMLAQKIFLRGMGVDIQEEQIDSYLQYMSQSADWTATVRLLPTIANECKVACQEDSKFEKYTGVSSETLLMRGTEGDEINTLFNQRAFKALKSVIPDLTIAVLQGLDHNAPDINAPEQVAQKLAEFFSNS